MDDNKIAILKDCDEDYRFQVSWSNQVAELLTERKVGELFRVHRIADALQKHLLVSKLMLVIKVLNCILIYM